MMTQMAGSRLGAGTKKAGDANGSCSGSREWGDLGQTMSQFWRRRRSRRRNGDGHDVDGEGELRGDGHDVEGEVEGTRLGASVLPFAELVFRYVRFLRQRSWAAFVQLVERQLMIEAHGAMRAGLYQ